MFFLRDKFDGQLTAFETHFDVPLPMGPMRAGIYWFSRPEA